MSLLRRIAPKSLYARTILIVVIPIFIMQAVITYVFFNRHWEAVSGNLSANVAGDIAVMTELYAKAAGPISQSDILLLAREDMDMAMRYEPSGLIPDKDKTSVFTVLDSTLEQKLEAALTYPFWYNTSNYPAYVEIRVQLSNGYLVFLPRRDRVFATNGPLFVLWMIGTTLLLGFVAVIFLRNQVRSIQRLAQAAEDFGRGNDRPDFKPSGATEVRLAGHAFMAMRQRINRHLSQRTSMLAGVSHDLRTPLTRMKLALALQPDNQDTMDLKTDIDEMEGMLDEYLNFARTQLIDDAETFDLSALVHEIANDMEREGHHLEVTVPEEFMFEARRNALKRAIGNLVSNGFKHAKHASLNVDIVGSDVHIIVDDDGPGIDPAHYDEVFKPFSRLDEARNQNVAGVGLGLAVVRDITRAHGGSIELAKSPLGGLRALIKLPF